MRSGLRIAVGIATAGRRLILAETLVELARQTRSPEAVLICPAAADDFDASQAAKLPFPVQIVEGSRGSSAQRNAILDAAQQFDVVMFFDDDFFAEPTYLAELEDCVTANPAVVVATGRTLADDIKGPGLSAGEARTILASFVPSEAPMPLINQYSGYGCNMAVRLEPVYAHGLRFDENLPLYGWAEDVDFSRQLAAYGRIVKNPRMTGVHLGVKGGRTSGVRYGYSQIANPYYLWRKGTTRAGGALSQMVRNILVNIMKSIKPEPWIDRRGRAFGNVLGLADFFRGRLDPLLFDQRSGVRFLPAGPKSNMPHTNELLASDAMKKLITLLQESYDYIIVDLPPLIPVVDARASTNFIDAYLYTIEWGTTKVDLVRHGLLNAPEIYERLLRVILNKVDMGSIGRYERYRNNYYYEKYRSRYSSMDQPAPLKSNKGPRASF
jgi:GT2 family glycosyltransferase